MAGGESIYEDGGVGAQGSCEVGEKCLESEALAELMEGNGLAMPATTKALLDEIKALPVQKAAKDMNRPLKNKKAVGICAAETMITGLFRSQGIYPAISTRRDGS